MRDYLPDREFEWLAAASSLPSAYQIISEQSRYVQEVHVWLEPYPANDEVIYVMPRPIAVLGMFVGFEEDGKAFVVQDNGEDPYLFSIRRDEVSRVYVFVEHRDQEADEFGEYPLERILIKGGRR